MYARSNFRGHVRYHWKLAGTVASQKAKASTPTKLRLTSTAESQSYDPSASLLGSKKLIQSNNIPQPDIAGSSKLDNTQPSSLSEVGCTQIDRVATPDIPVTNPEDWRPQGRKRSLSEAFSEKELSVSKPDLARGAMEPEKSSCYSIFLSIARALSAIRMKPGTIFIPREQSISYEELVLVADRYFDIDKAIAVYPLVDQLPDRFRPSDETFETVGMKGESERVRCPFCTFSFNGIAAKKSMKLHLESHWWYTCGLKMHTGIPTDEIESIDSSYAGPSIDRIPIPLPPSVPSTMQANTNSEKVYHSIARVHMDLEMNVSNHGTGSQAKEPPLQSIRPVARAQDVPKYV